MANFKGGTYAEQQADPVNQLLASGKYRNTPNLQAYFNGQMSQEDAIAAIKASGEFNPTSGPIVNGVAQPGGVTPNAGLGTGFSAGGQNYGQAPADKVSPPQNPSIAAPNPNPAQTPPPASNGAPGSSGGAGNPNPAPSADPNAFNPSQSSQVQSALDHSFQLASSGGIDTSNRASLTDYLTSFLKGVAATPPPAPPSEVSTFQNLNSVQGVDQATNDYNNAKATLANIQNDIVAKQNDIKSQQGPQITSAVVNGQLQYVDAKTAAALQQAQTQMQLAADTLNMKQNTVAQIMQYTGQDYANANNYYQQNYTNSMNMLNAVEGIIGTQQSATTAAQTSARANINIISGLIADKPDSFKNPTQDQKTLWQQLELQAGLPLGTIQGYAQARPGAKTILHYTNPDGSTSIVAVDAAGKIIHDTVTGGTSTGTGSSGLGGVPGTTGSSTINATAPGYSSKAVPGAGGLTQAAIDQAAMQYVMTGTMPSIGLGSTGPGGQRKTAIENRAGELGSSQSIAVNKAQLSSLTQALGQQTEYLNTTQRSVKAADSGIKQLTAAFSGKVNNQTMPIANIIANAAKYQLSPGDVSAYRAGLLEVANEYTQVFSRGGQVSDTVRNRAQDIVDGNISVADLKKVSDELQAQGAIVIKAAQDQTQSIQDQMNGIIGGGSTGGNNQSNSNDPLGIR